MKISSCELCDIGYGISATDSNTDYRRVEDMIKVASLFSQLVRHVSRLEFHQLVAKHEAERGAKGFACWTQFVAMMFCHLAHADSLREICGGLSFCLGKLRHLGIQKSPKKSTQHGPCPTWRPCCG
jgi:hypothetical protein